MAYNISMRILFYAAKTYDKDSFDAVSDQYSGIDIEYTNYELGPRSASLADGYDAVCAFVSANVSARTLTALKKHGVGAVLMRCAGYNNVDLDKAKELGIIVKVVPNYSPEAVAELAMGLALAANRRLCKSYNRVRDNNFNIDGLCGVNLHGKTAGIIGTGKIGSAMCRICHGFGMKVIAYDVDKNLTLKRIIEYVSLDELLERSDLISLHCPLTDSNYHMINSDAINKMKNGVILVNTSRGALIDTPDLVKGIKMGKFHGVGLDVYEEEGDDIYNDHSSSLYPNPAASRLMDFPNVVMTSHQGFYTKEALRAIAETTFKNAKDVLDDKRTMNDVA